MQVYVLTYLQFGEETKDKFPVKRLKKWLLIPKGLKSWNGNKEIKAREKKEGMNCPELQPLVWRQWSPTWPDHNQRTEHLNALQD